MGNAAGKLSPCFCDAGTLSSRHHDITILFSDPHPLRATANEDDDDEDDIGIGHSYCYIRPVVDPHHGPDPPPPIIPHYFRTISGASLSANTSTALSTTSTTTTYLSFDRAASFESSPSFASVALQPIPRDLMMISSGPLPRNSGAGSILGSGPIERGFLSGPIERGFISGPMDPGSGPIDRGSGPMSRPGLCLQKSYEHDHGHDQGLVRWRRGKFGKWMSMKAVRDAISGVMGKKGKRSSSEEYEEKNSSSSSSGGGGGGGKKNSRNLSSQVSLEDECYNREDHCDRDHGEGRSEVDNNVQWAQGKAGEDRVHVVVSEDHGWVFVGIYDGFNGPDAPDFLMSNLYTAVHKELLVTLMGNEMLESEMMLLNERINSSACSSTRDDSEMEGNGRCRSRKWKCGWDSEGLEHEVNGRGLNGMYNVKHEDVLRALSDALRKTEEAYFEMAEKTVLENPELFMMGSCVLVMLMIGDDVYLMNVGDSRAVVGQKVEPDHKDIRSYENDPFDDWLNIAPLQLTVDHNTQVKEEVRRIKNEHLDDPSAVANDCVKGSLKVTRAFGAGFLKQPKWNEELLEMFRIDYVGKSPYITCLPSLRHHKLGPRDKFLILSSDGLYQYFTNEEAVAEVETFMTMTSEGDPAQHLIEEVLFRAAKKAGIDFHELLDIPQGERRRYHDDVSVIVISFEGRIWRSSV